MRDNMKKTIKVEELRNQINFLLSLDTLSQVEKSSLVRLLSRILGETGNYKGFYYLYDFNAIPLEEARAKEYNRAYL